MFFKKLAACEWDKKDIAGSDLGPGDMVEN